MPTEAMLYSGMQVLAPDNASPNTTEAQQARIKDPLWFLARQWQTGEFEAENGGRVAQIEVGWTSRAVDRIYRGDEAGGEALAPDTPLDFAAEDEGDDGASPAWESAAMEFRFGVSAGGSRVNATGYDGRGLDWFHFDLDVEWAEPAGGEAGSRRVVPTTLAYHGMPHPRWWRFEESTSFVESPNDPEPNVMSMLLPEFLYADSNNWYVVPIEQRAGCMRRIDRVRVVDSFGIGTDIDPVATKGDGGWQVFTLTDEDGDQAAPGEILFVPNVGITTIEGEVLEEVALIRDEEANLVWAVERIHQDPETGLPVEHRVADSAHDDGEAGGPGADLTGAPAYRLKTHGAAHWIPYVPRFLEGAGRTPGQTYLRRARSIESASRAAPQYQSKLVSESWKLFEETVPRTGLRVQRLWRFVRGSDGTGHFWVGRRKDAGGRERSAGLSFDVLE